MWEKQQFIIIIIIIIIIIVFKNTAVDIPTYVR